MTPDVTYLAVTAAGVTSLAVVTVTSPMSGASRAFLSDLSTFAYSSSTGDRSERSLSELQGSAQIEPTLSYVYIIRCSIKSIVVCLRDRLKQIDPRFDLLQLEYYYTYLAYA